MKYDIARISYRNADNKQEELTITKTNQLLPAVQPTWEFFDLSLMSRSYTPAEALTEYVKHLNDVPHDFVTDPANPHEDCMGSDWLRFGCRCCGLIVDGDKAPGFTSPAPRENPKANDICPGPVPDEKKLPWLRSGYVDKHPKIDRKWEEAERERMGTTRS